MKNPVARYEKMFTSLKYFLIGREYHLALKALHFARTYHTGLRKDHVTPEMLHQIEICQYLTTLRGMQNEETVIAVALLHDIMEDYDISFEEMTAKFGSVVTEKVWLLTKKYKGEKKDSKAYFDAISQDSIASLVKLSDRVNNLNSMIGVFTKEKQISYTTEVQTYFLQMLKQAKYNFPEQNAAYYNIQFIMETQVAFLTNMNK